MNTKTTLSITDARNKIFELAEAVQKPNTYYTLTDRGRPKAVLLSAEEFDSLIESLELAHDEDLLKDFKEAEKDFAEGKYTSWQEVKQELGLREPAMVLRDKGKKKYKAKTKSYGKAKRKKLSS